MPISPYRTILAHAVRLSGGRENFAGAVGVDADDVRAWIMGLGDVPEEVFQKALDVFLSEHLATAPKQQ